MRRNLSNITKEEASAKIAERNKQRNCPVCGSKRNRIAELSRHSDGLVTFLRDNNFRLEQDSCILCVEKHLSDAKRAIEKQRKETEGVKIELQRLAAIGNLREATDESTEFQNLHDLLAIQERQYRYNDKDPDWEKIAAVILEVKAKIQEEDQEK